MYYSDGIFTSAYKELREGIAAKGGVIAKGAAPAAKKEDPKAKGGEEKGANTSDEDRVKQALYDIRYRAKREGVPVAQAMTDYLKHSGSLGPKARAELKKKLMGEEFGIKEGLKQARKNIGMDPDKPSCWKGYKAKGTKMKGGKEVPDCQKEQNEQQVQRQQLQLNRKKLQLQTKATQKNQKTDMSMREEVSTEELLNLYNILENETLSYMHDIAEARVEEILSEESSTQKKGRGGETLYKVRVINNDGRSEVRYASRSKISELRGNSNIKSVEITGYGDAYNEKPKSKGGEKKLDPVGKEDGDVDNDGDKDKSDKYLLNRRKAIGKAMAKEEYVDENRRAASAAGASKDDSKKQPDPSKSGFTGVGNMSIDQIRKMSARIEKEKSAKK